jgi:hydrogenase nickel incorporation protein HypA/HybF
LHELGIATHIARVVGGVVDEHEATRVGEIVVEVGMLAGVDEESLDFCFTALAKGTKLEGARLKMERLVPRAKCRRCGAEYEISIDDFRCKACGSGDFDLDGGSDICVKQVEVE